MAPAWSQWPNDPLATRWLAALATEGPRDTANTIEPQPGPQTFGTWNFFLLAIILVIQQLSALIRSLQRSPKALSPSSSLFAPQLSLRRPSFTPSESTPHPRPYPCNKASHLLLQFSTLKGESVLVLLSITSLSRLRFCGEIKLGFVINYGVSVIWLRHRH